MHGEKTLRLSMALVGIVGVVLLIGSFKINPGPPPGASIQEILEFGRQYASTIVLGTWTQAVGSALNVIFALGVVHLSGATRKLSGQVTLLSGAAILATSLTECSLYLASLEAGQSGDIATLQATVTLIHGVQHAFLIAPALLLPVGWVLLRSELYPRGVALSGLLLGAVLQALGLVGIVYPIQPVIDMVLIVQGAWFLVASAMLALQSTSATVSSTMFSPSKPV